MKWYQVIGLIVWASIILYVVIAPWLSIIDIHRSIDRLTDEISKWREESKHDYIFQSQDHLRNTYHHQEEKEKETDQD